MRRAPASQFVGLILNRHQTVNRDAFVLNEINSHLFFNSNVVPHFLSCTHPTITLTSPRRCKFSDRA